MKAVTPFLVFVAVACSSDPESSPSNPMDAQPASQPMTPPGSSELPDLGIYNLAQPLPGLYTSGQVTEEQVRALAGRKMRLINLRTDGEGGTGWEQTVAAELGLGYVHLPIDGTDGIDEANARRLGEILAQRPEDTTDLLYCGSSNRVGALLGLKAHVVDGLSAEAAYQLGVKAGATRYQPVLRERLGLRD